MLIIEKFAKILMGPRPFKSFKEDDSAQRIREAREYFRLKTGFVAETIGWQANEVKLEGAFTKHPDPTANYYVTIRCNMMGEFPVDVGAEDSLEDETLKEKWARAAWLEGHLEECILEEHRDYAEGEVE